MVSPKTSKPVGARGKRVLLTSTNVRLIPSFAVAEDSVHSDLQRAIRLERVLGPLVKANRTLDLTDFGAAELELIEEIGRSFSHVRSVIAAEVGLDVRLEVSEIRKGSIEIFGIEVSAPKNGLANWLATALLLFECIKELPPALDAIAELQKRIEHLVHGAVQQAADNINRRSVDSSTARYWETTFDATHQPYPRQILDEAGRLLITQQRHFEEDYSSQTNRIR